jgi:hypothetical protein
VSHVLLLINRSYFLVGAKIEYLFYLLQAKNKKITADYKSLTLAAIKAPFLYPFVSDLNCSWRTGGFFHF